MTKSGSAQRAWSSVQATGRLPVACMLIGMAGLALAAGFASADAAYLWSLLVLLVLSPVAEEAVFRAGLQEWLLRQSAVPWVANLVTALAFGLAHVLARGDVTAIAVALPALLLGAAYERWRKLRYCAVLHAGMNLLWLAYGGANSVAWMPPWGP